MTNEDAIYLRHIRDAIHQIQGYVQGVSEPEFMSDEILQDAVIPLDRHLLFGTRSSRIFLLS